MSALWGNKRFDSVVLKPVGRSGGLACIWNPSLFSKSGVVVNNRFIWLKGDIVGVQEELNIMNIYGPQDPVQKRELWQSLLQLKNSSPGLWLLMGDFNAVRTSDERLNYIFCKYSANDFIDSANLFEYRMGGRKLSYFKSDGAVNQLIGLG